MKSAIFACSINPLVQREQKRQNPQTRFNWLLVAQFLKEMADFGTH